MGQNTVPLIPALGIIITEVLLSFFGPMATLDKTTLIVTPVYNSTRKDGAYLEDLTDIVESHMVRTGSYTIVRQIRFEEYFDKHPDEKKEFQPYEDYLNIAREGGIDKVLVLSLYNRGSGGVTLNFVLYDYSYLRLLILLLVTVILERLPSEYTISIKLTLVLTMAQDTRTEQLYAFIGTLRGKRGNYSPITPCS